MKVTVTAKDSFAHGAKVYHEGDPVDLSIYDARDLAKRGLTSEPVESDVEPELEVKAKMADEVQNKMQPALSNKSMKVKP